MKITIALLVALALAGCAKKTQEVSVTTNPEFKVELLFTHGDCRVYRFWDDAGHPGYYARCHGGEAPQPLSNDKGGATMRPDRAITLISKSQKEEALVIAERWRAVSERFEKAANNWHENYLACDRNLKAMQRNMSRLLDDVAYMKKQ